MDDPRQFERSLQPAGPRCVHLVQTQAPATAVIDRKLHVIGGATVDWAGGDLRVVQIFEHDKPAKLMEHRARHATEEWWLCGIRGGFRQAA